MAAAKKNSESKLDIKDMDEAPFDGYVVFGDGRYFFRTKGAPLPRHENAEPIAFVESKEEACFMTGVDFIPSDLDFGCFSKATLSELDKREKQIKASIAKIDKSFETIAFNLHWINARQTYIAKGFENIVSYSEKIFGYAKTTCYSLIGVVDRFAERDADGNIIEELSPLVKGFSVSKLSLMVGLTNDQIKQLKPDMSVRDIKKYIKELEGKPLPALSEGNGEGDVPDGTSDTGEENIIDSTATEVTRNVLLTCKGSDDYSKKSSKIDGYIFRVLKAHPDAVIEISYTLP